MKLGVFLRELGQPVAYYPKLVKITGGVLANLFLCQMYYWQGKQDDPTGWIYKTQAEIEAETGLSRTEQETARRLLRQRGLIKERYKGLPRRLEFWLDEEELENRWAFFLEYKGEKPLVADAKAAQKRTSHPTAKPCHSKQALSESEVIEPIPDNNCSIMQESRIIECRNPALLDVEIPQAIVQEPCKQVCGNPAGNPYTEITTENTCRDYNTYTLNPPQAREQQQPYECVEPEAVEVIVEVEQPHNHSFSSSSDTPSDWQQPKTPGQDNYWAAPQKNEKYYQNRQPQFSKNLDGSERLPWDTNKRGVFDSQFENWMARSLMQYPAYQNLMAGELLTKVRKHISAGRYDLKRRDELLIEWEAMHERHNANDFSPPNSLTAKAAARRAKIARALNMEVC